MRVTQAWEAGKERGEQEGQPWTGGDKGEMLLRLEMSVTSCGFPLFNSAVLRYFPELLCLVKS